MTWSDMVLSWSPSLAATITLNIPCFYDALRQADQIPGLGRSASKLEPFVTLIQSFRAKLEYYTLKQMIPLLQDAERFRPQKNRTINSCRLSLQHLNKLQLLNHIDEEVRTLNREHNRFLLSDTNALLHKLVHEGDSSFVFEKIGANIRNVMIDEFQDTSRMQCLVRLRPGAAVLIRPGGRTDKISKRPAENRNV